MRILLATEGESDEIVARRLLERVYSNSVVQPKRMPARGIAVVLRLLPDIVRAAHFGHFDLLVVHFDLDDTLPENALHSGDSPRRQEVASQISTTMRSLRSSGGRTDSLTAILMTPAQSTDAWLRWALLDGDGKKWENKDRHAMKRAVFGDPPRKIIETAVAFADRLIVQMAECDTWPRSLRDFLDELEALKKA
jgi:hypothetical protein